jgi:hypothetical protein
MPLSTAYTSLRDDLSVGEDRAIPELRWPAVYLETSVVSYLTARLSRDLRIARHQRLTRVWWHRYRELHPLHVSALVVEEVAGGDSAAARARTDAIRGIDTLPFDARSERLAEKLVGGGRLPEKALADAEHIAIAATNGVPTLITWNCKHLANRVLRNAVVRTCEAEGFRCPEICTPEDLMRTYSYARPPT